MGLREDMQRVLVKKEIITFAGNRNLSPQSFGSSPNSVTGEKYINMFTELNAGWSVVSVYRHMKFEIFTVVKILIVVFCFVTPGTLLGGCQHFGRKYCFCLRAHTLKMEAECSSKTRTLVLTYQTALYDDPEDHSVKLW